MLSIERCFLSNKNFLLVWFSIAKILFKKHRGSLEMLLEGIIIAGEGTFLVVKEPMVALSSDGQKGTEKLSTACAHDSWLGGMPGAWGSGVRILEKLDKLE